MHYSNSATTKIQILLKILWHRFFLKHKKINSLALLEKIGDYSLVNKIIRPESKVYQVGIYQNSQGEKFICKQVNKSIPSLHYYWLHNEIRVYQLVGALYQDPKSKLKTVFPNIILPQLIHVYEDKQRLLIITKMFDGQFLQTYDPKFIAQTYNEIFAYFSYINTVINKKKLIHRGAISMCIMLPVFVVLAMIRQPRQKQLVWRGLRVFLQSVPALLSNNQASFTHRDLSQSNILVNGEKICIIDFEHAVLANPTLDIVHILLRCWDSEKFREEFFNLENIKTIYQDKKSFQSYRGVAAYSTIFDLANRRSSNPQQTGNFLQYIVNIKYEPTA